jgi:1,4-alpha-glucan branching enzyme
MIKKRPSENPGKMLVTFELPSAIWAERVNLVGDFNDWNETSMAMTQDRDDAHWRITLELAANREYQFRYLVNGTDWHNDWHADKYVPNQHGSDNSVVVTRLN